MVIYNQPFSGALGDQIKMSLTNQYDDFYIFSAFAKNSGVLRLKTELLDFKSRGGRIHAYIGVDLKGTSYEALINLLSICDDLFIVHSSNSLTTFHSKIYLLTNAQTAWTAIGSNNLTGGGLWTNFETCTISNLQLPCPEVQTILDMAAQYEDPNYPCSIRLTSISDIDSLRNLGYLITEASHRSSIIQARANTRNAPQPTNLFGRQRITLPTINNGGTATNTAVPNPAPTTQVPQAITPISTLSLWAETRRSITGGSHNQIDLSKRGKICGGNVTNTILNNADPTMMLGGVKFFDIDPDNTSIVKNITINYLGKDYYPAEISYFPGNSNWRLLLKGVATDSSGDKLSLHGKNGEFSNSILLFDKIRSDYYCLSVVPHTDITSLQSISIVWGKNGTTPSGRAYGIY